MKVYKLKGFVLPTIYLVAIGTIVLSVILIGNTIRSFNTGEEVDVAGVIIDNSFPVNQEINHPEPEKNKEIIKPFTVENVTIIKHFYDKDAPEETQINSLIFYENTYMQNSGILYKSDERFEVVATMDGIVSNVKEDRLLGFVIQISHNSNLTTVYQSLSEAKVTVGQSIKQGDVIGLSGPNNIDKSSENQLLFEVIHKGKLINPITFFESDIKTFEE